MNDPVTIHFLETDHGTRLAWTGREVFGKPTIIFFAGHGSDMDGTKAIAVDSWAEHNGLVTAAMASPQGRFWTGPSASGKRIASPSLIR